MLRQIALFSVLLSLAIPSVAFAAETKPVDPTPPPKVAIVPHRAVYNMSLGSIKNGSGITGVSGKMFFEWGDTCDGWAVQQRMQLHFSYAEGDETNVNSAVITWESKDGKRYNFNVRRVTNDKDSETFKGRASLTDKGGTSKYTLPKAKEIKLPPESVFPSAHTSLIIQKAMAGEKLFSRAVFDGSDEDGLADVSVFIGSKIEGNASPDLAPALKNNPLLAVPEWPVRMAFFKPTSETGEPEYEMNLSLLSNGVAKSMKIDYGDFSVSGVLINLETLPPSGC